MSRSGQVLKQDSRNNFYWGDRIVTPAVSANLLAYAYLRFEQEKLLPMIFHEGVPDVSFFLDFFGKRSQTLFCYRQVAGHPELILQGMGWINALTVMGNYKKAEVGMSFFRKTRDLVPFGQMMIEWAFAKMGFDVMFGTTPAPNRAALRYRERLGFKSIGPLEHYSTWEGALCDVYISWLTKPTWDSMRPFEVEVT